MTRLWSLALLCWLALAAAATAAEGPASDLGVDGLVSRPALEGYVVELTAWGPAWGKAVVEVEDAAGGHQRQWVEGPGPHTLSFTLIAPAVSATIDPDGAIDDPDRFNNHVPRRLVVTPWPAAPPDAYVLRYFPGLTFKQGQAPVRPRGAPMMPPAEGPMGLGIGLEGRRSGEHGWQVLTNFGSSPFAPSLDPRFSLHGYYLPHPNWGLDGDLATDLSGRLTGEVGTSLITWDGPGPASEHPVLAHQLRLALGRQSLAAAPGGGYPYGQLNVFRDDSAAIGLSSHLALFGGLDGAWRATLDTQSAHSLSEALAWRLGTSLGWSGGGLAPANRLGAGLLSQDWLTSTGRITGRLALMAPLARGLDWPLGPLATLAQIEGSVYLEGAQLWAADTPGRTGAFAGIGAELTLVEDTILGMPMALNLGYAVPIWEPDGPRAPWPGRLYLGLTDAYFPRAVSR